MPLHKEFKSLWESAGYSRNAGSSAVVKPPNKQFRRVYHLTNPEYAISSIALGRIKVSRFSDLNDPFELMSMNFRERQARQNMRDLKSAYDSKTGLLCFSSDWTDPVLWSHYGAKHYGICLGFDLERSLGQEVRYESKRLASALNADPNPKDLPQKTIDMLLCTKFSNWQYEKEVRVFVPLKEAEVEGRLYFKKFSDSIQLAEVILGPQCTLSLESVRTLLAAVAPNAIAFRARLANRSFSVVPQENSVP